MTKKFHYSFLDKLFFYLSYFFYKLILPFEIKRPRYKMWWYEFIYSIIKFKDYNISIPWRYSQDEIKTRFGTFKIRINTSDAANVSPAFERRDQNFLLRLIKNSLKQNQKVLFLDIGGDIGTYSVLVANRFKNFNIKIKCFEPINESFRLIEENLKLNKIEDKVDLYPFALMNEDNEETHIHLNISAPGSSSMINVAKTETKDLIVKARKLDNLILKEIENYNVVVFKIDVEGLEKKVLKGSSGILNSGKKIYIMVEDFINPDIISYLEINNWSFMSKVTVYNSWWSYQLLKA